MIKLSSLSLGAFLKDGGQGEVYELTSAPDQLLKRYKPGVTVDPAGLEVLVAWRRGLNTQDRKLVDQYTAWPLEIVDCEDGTLGILMKRAPHVFWHVVEGDTLPRDLSWAFMEDAARFVGLEPATATASVTIMFQITSIFDVFHRNGVVYGDLSAANVLWSGGRRPTIFVIDCDAAEVVGQPRGLQEAQTPLWDCPWPGVTARERDEYKLALAFLRLFFHYEGPLTDTTHNIQIPPRPPVTREAADLLGAGLRQVSIRPTAADWPDPLRTLERGLKARQIA